MIIITLVHIGHVAAVSVALFFLCSAQHDSKTLARWLIACSISFFHVFFEILWSQLAGYGLLLGVSSPHPETILTPAAIGTAIELSALPNFFVTTLGMYALSLSERFRTKLVIVLALSAAVVLIDLIFNFLEFVSFYAAANH